MQWRCLMTRLPHIAEISTGTGPSFALFVKRYLQYNEEGYTYEMFKSYNSVLMDNMLLPCSRNYAYRTIYILKALNLIDKSRSSKSERLQFRRIYYTLVDLNEEDPKWLNHEKYYSRN